MLAAKIISRGLLVGHGWPARKRGCQICFSFFLFQHFRLIPLFKTSLTWTPGVRCNAPNAIASIGGGVKKGIALQRVLK